MQDPTETHQPTLHLICGRIASGKSTLATELGRRDGTVVIREDDWLSGLYGNEMATIADYLRCVARLRGVIGPHVVALLNAGVSVVLDFQANTVETRAWMRGILDRTGAAHVLHVLDVPDAICLERLRARNAAGGHPFSVTEAQFHQISRHFAFPTPEEGFEVQVHRPDPERWCNERSDTGRSAILRFRSDSDGPHRNYDTFGGWRLKAVLAASGDPDHADAALNSRSAVSSDFWMPHGVRMSA